jgi:hypothetical protein
MLKSTIIVDEYSDPAATLNRVRNLCSSPSLKNGDALRDQIVEIINEYSERGSKLIAANSRFSISRTLNGEDYEIVISARFGLRPSIILRIKRLLGL